MQSPRTVARSRVAERQHKVLIETAFWLSLWYCCSGGTLFLNKIILTQLSGDVQVLGGCQMAMTAFLGAVKVYGSRLCQTSKPVAKYGNAMDEAEALATFKRNMFLVAVMRSSTILLGLVSLANVAASFTETIKASAPFFTVIFTHLILREHTSVQVNLALVPVMLGLVVCSGTELSFNLIGFLAAITTNCIDCVQVRRHPCAPAAQPTWYLPGQTFATTMKHGLFPSVRRTFSRRSCCPAVCRPSSSSSTPARRRQRCSCR